MLPNALLDGGELGSFVVAFSRSLLFGILAGLPVGILAGILTRILFGMFRARYSSIQRPVAPANSFADFVTHFVYGFVTVSMIGLLIERLYAVDWLPSSFPYNTFASE